jgi:hypothetical protein
VSAAVPGGDESVSCVQARACTLLVEGHRIVNRPFDYFKPFEGLGHVARLMED